LPCEGKGDAAVRLTNDTRKTAIREVAYVPNLSVNLLSVSKLSERVHTTIFSPDGCYIYRNASVKVKGELVASATEENRMYSLNCETYLHCANTTITNGSDKLNLWHRRPKTTNLKTSLLMADNKKMQILTEEKSKLENQVEELQTRCNDLDLLKQELKAVTTEWNELARERVLLKSRARRSEAKCDAMRKSIEGLKTETEETRAEIKRFVPLQKELKEARQECESAKKETA
jgi:hypothetical protein